MFCNDTILARQEAQARYKRRRILIIDDEDSQTEVLSLRLSQQGFETLTAHEGLTGLKLAREERPNLIILDLRLPDVNGLNICEELTDESGTCGIPVIVVSGMDGPDIVRRSRAAGCYYYVRKPYDPNALLLLIESAVAERDTL